MRKLNMTSRFSLLGVMVGFVKWLKSLHFSVGGSGSDSNAVEQRVKEVSSELSTHAFMSA